MWLRVLSGNEKALGPDHISTLSTIHNLGNLYQDQGRLAEAEQMYQRALAGFETALGPVHTSTLSTVGNLGNLYADQGKLAETEQMYQRALAGFETALGPAHTLTLSTIDNLGSLYANQGKLAEAEQMYQRARYGKECDGCGGCPWRPPKSKPSQTRAYRAATPQFVVLQSLLQGWFFLTSRLDGALPKETPKPAPRNWSQN
jgi:tetratricopeptide (TPR) repeat protein